MRLEHNLLVCGDDDEINCFDCNTDVCGCTVIVPCVCGACDV